MTAKKILVLASGNGSNFEAIVKYFKNLSDDSKLYPNICDVEIKLVSDNEDSYALERAKKLNISSSYVPFDKLEEYLDSQEEFDLYVLAGFMRILPETVLKNRTFINIHPSYLPEYKGKDAIKRIFNAGEKTDGVTIHYVDKQIDAGKIISQERVIIKPNDTLLSFEKRVHSKEHKMYPKVIKDLLLKLNVLVAGGGAREHAIVCALKKSPLIKNLYLADANDGFKNEGIEIKYKNLNDLAQKAHQNKVDILIAGSEDYLKEGIADIFLKKNIAAIGAGKNWARLETSKIFAKKFMQKYGIKTSEYIVVEDMGGIETALKTFDEPPVIKADGLCKGKGVYIANTFTEAKVCAEKMLKGEFGDSSLKILFERKLKGFEASLMSLWDGKTLVSFPLAVDYKRLSDESNALNTGGMGSFCPLKLKPADEHRLNIYKNSLECALIEAGADFCGVIYSGLMFSKEGLYVLEYNMRFGDPEIQSLLEIADFDLLEVFYLMSIQKLDCAKIKFKKETAYCVVIASEGYPLNPVKGGVIEGLDIACEKYGVKIYKAGVKITDGVMSANGGRILSVVKKTEKGKDKTKTLKSIYDAVSEIKFKDKIYRLDIGK